MGNWAENDCRVPANNIFLISCGSYRENLSCPNEIPTYNQRNIRCLGGGLSDRVSCYSFLANKTS